jgi:carboxylesterase type B
MQPGTPNIATYNMSFLVNTSVEIGHPIISVAINYRTNIFGFLSSFEVANANATNIGFYDQRLALHWVQENIGAFGTPSVQPFTFLKHQFDVATLGGDPAKVTIQGQSAGGQSVAYQALAFGGRDDHLFRGIIQESGFFQGVAIDPLQFYTEPYKNLTRFVGCGAAAVPLDCLKSVDFTMLQDYLNLIGVSFVWNPVMDNEFFQTYPSDILEAGKMPKLAVMAGTNTDEGLDFTQTGLNTT